MSRFTDALNAQVANEFAASRFSRSSSRSHRSGRSPTRSPRSRGSRATEGNILLVEDQLARTSAAGEGVDPTAPPAAGGAL